MCGKETEAPRRVIYLIRRIFGGLFALAVAFFAHSGGFPSCLRRLHIPPNAFCFRGGLCTVSLAVKRHTEKREDPGLAWICHGRISEPMLALISVPLFSKLASDLVKP